MTTQPQTIVIQNRRGGSLLNTAVLLFIILLLIYFYFLWKNGSKGGKGTLNPLRVLFGGSGGGGSESKDSKTTGTTTDANNSTGANAHEGGLKLANLFNFGSSSENNIPLLKPGETQVNQSLLDAIRGGITGATDGVNTNPGTTDRKSDVYVKDQLTSFYRLAAASTDDAKLSTLGIYRISSGDYFEYTAPNGNYFKGTIAQMIDVYLKENNYKLPMWF